MDLMHKDSLKVGGRVAVFMGAVVGQVYGTPPIVTTATVLEDPDSEHVWLGVDFASNSEQLPQRYKIQEVLGHLLPLAHVEHHEDGSITGTLPEGYVGP